VSGFSEAVTDLNRRMLATFGIPPFSLGPEPLRCPADGWTRDRCLAAWGRDPAHEEAIRESLSLSRNNPGSGYAVHVAGWP
jgi:hypothetical protein